MRRKIGTTKRRRKAAPRRKTTTRRRRRISGIGGFDAMGTLMKAAGLGAGAVAGRELDVIAKKMLPSLSPIMLSAIQIGAGALIPMFIKSNKFVALMGDGMMANGVVSGMVNLGVINGIGSGSMVSYRINGTGRLRTIAGGANLSAIAGGGNLSAIAGNALPQSNRTRASNNVSMKPGERMY